MIELKEQYPYIDDNGNEKENLTKHYAEDENGEKYYIKQVETDAEYGEAIDIYPCQYTYEATDIKIEDETENENEINIEENTNIHIGNIL